MAQFPLKKCCPRVTLMPPSLLRCVRTWRGGDKRRGSRPRAMEGSAPVVCPDDSRWCGLLRFIQ